MRAVLLFVSAVITTCLCAPHAGGMASVSQIAWRGKPVKAEEGWPAGASNVINDPARTTGWNPWFTELPNDVNHYDFETQTAADLQRIVEKLSAITGAVVRLSPSGHAVQPGWGENTAVMTGTVARLVIGNQKVLDQWFARLEEVRHGVRKFGTQEYTEALKAHPPTLTIYAGHPSVSIEELKIPPNVPVTLEPSSARQRTSSDKVKTQLNAFIERHNARRGRTP